MRLFEVLAIEQNFPWELTALRKAKDKFRAAYDQETSSGAFDKAVRAGNVRIKAIFAKEDAKIHMERLAGAMKDASEEISELQKLEEGDGDVAKAADRGEKRKFLEAFDSKIAEVAKLRKKLKP